MKNCKIYVNGYSREIQNKLRGLGCQCINGNIEKIYNEMPFLYVENNEYYFDYRNDMFQESTLPEVTADEILSMEPEHEFKPFDKVLVRDDDESEWKCNFYSHKREHRFGCGYSVWEQCIPYEGNEHLVGTTNPA